MRKVKNFTPARPTRVIAPKRSEQRIQSHRFLNSRPWGRLRDAFKDANPLCHDCERDGVLEAATEVHHIIGRDQRPDLALDWNNLMSLCKRCHSRRTARGE